MIHVILLLATNEQVDFGAASEHIWPLLLLHCVLLYTLYIHIFSQGNVTKNIKLMSSKSNPHFETTDMNPDRTITQS